MNINIDEITFIIVTHQSEKVIKNCSIKNFNKALNNKINYILQNSF